MTVTIPKIKDLTKLKIHSEIQSNATIRGGQTIPQSKVILTIFIAKNKTKKTIKDKKCGFY